MAVESFFEEQTPSSYVKARIVSDYFPQYCRIIARRYVPQQFGYYDLFAGPGIYKDGNPSTPIMIGEKCMEDSFLKDRVWMVFNDMEHAETLQRNFESRFPIGTFKYKPCFRDKKVGECEGIDQFLLYNTMIKTPYGIKNNRPSLLFIDPFGYKNINTSVLAQFMSYWGNEVFIFINVKRINAAFGNQDFFSDLRNVFPNAFDEVQKEKGKLNTVPERHQYIIDKLGEEFSILLGGHIYYTAFRFLEEDQKTTSHYILHVTKGLKGFDLIKSVYNKFANIEQALTGSFTYTFDPKMMTDENRNNPIIEMINQQGHEESISYLKDALLKTFNGRRVNAESLFLQHHPNTRYSRQHYVEALRQLYEEGKIESEFIDGRNHQVSILLEKFCIIRFV